MKSADYLIALIQHTDTMTDKQTGSRNHCLGGGNKWMNGLAKEKQWNWQK